MIEAKKKVKIVRSWSVVKNKGKDTETQITIGQDIAGNLYAKCCKCEKNMVVQRYFDIQAKSSKFFAKCNSCKIIINL